MGISLFVGEGDDKEYPLGSSYWFNRWLNKIAEFGQFPNIMSFSPDKGVSSVDSTGQDFETGEVSLSGLKKETDSILNSPDSYPDWALEMAAIFKEAVLAAEKRSEVLTIQ